MTVEFLKTLVCDWPIFKYRRKRVGSKYQVLVNLLFCSYFWSEEIITAEYFFEYFLNKLLALARGKSILWSRIQNTHQQSLKEGEKKRKINWFSSRTQVSLSSANSKIFHEVVAEENAEFTFEVSSDFVSESKHLWTVKVKKTKHLDQHHS